MEILEKCHVSISMAGPCGNDEGNMNDDCGYFNDPCPTDANSSVCHDD